MSDLSAIAPRIAAERRLVGSQPTATRHYALVDLDARLAPLPASRLTIYRSFAECETAWRAAMATTAWYAFQSFDWLAVWQQTIGAAEGVEPYLVRLEDAAGKTVLILPLGIYREGWRRVLRFLGGVVTDYNAPLIDPDFAARIAPADMARLWTAIVGLLPNVDLAWLPRMPEAIEGVRNPMAALPGAAHTEDGHAAALPDTMAAFRKARSTRMFTDTRRRRRRLAEVGPVEYRSPAPESAEAAAIWPILARQKSRRWVETKCRDLFAEPPYVAFYRRLSEAGMQGGRVHVSCLKAGDTVVAAHWGIVCQGRFYFLIVGREAGDWDFYSPGRLLIEDLIEQSIAAPDIGIFDFTGGDEGFKLDWSDRTLPLYEYLAPCSLKGAAFIAVHRLRQRLKQNSRLRNWVRRLKGKAPK